MTPSYLPVPPAGARAAWAPGGLALLASLFLAACGGGSSPAPAPPPAPDQVPQSAAADDASWESFAIAQAPSDTTEPLKLDLIASVPSSETEEPIALP